MTSRTPNKSAIAIFDIDGTLADNRLQRTTPPDRFFTRETLSDLNENKNVGEAFRNLVKNPRFNVHIVTSREESLRHVTFSWLDSQFKISEAPQRIRMFMRPDSTPISGSWAWKATIGLMLARRIGHPEEMHIFEDDLEILSHYKRVLFDRVRNLRLHYVEDGCISLWSPAK